MLRLNKVLILLLMALFQVTGLLSQTVHTGKNNWQNRFVFANDNTTAIPLATRFKVDFDSENLYLTIICYDQKTKELQKLLPGKQGEWPLNDSVEIFLDPGQTYSKYFQIAVGVNGSLFDSRCPKQWMTKWTVKRNFSESFWVLHFILPFSDPGMRSPRIGDTWGINVCRNVKFSGNYFSTWAHVGSVFHNPASFGKLVFGSPELVQQLQTDRLQNDRNQLINELKEKGVYNEFKDQLKKLGNIFTATDLKDIRDELQIVEKLKGIKK